MTNCPHCGNSLLSSDQHEQEQTVAAARNREYEVQLNERVSFGKYRGETWGFVLDNNPAYICWAADNVEFFNPCTQLLTKAANRKSIKDAEYRARRRPGPSWGGIPFYDDEEDLLSDHWGSFDDYGW